MIIATQETIGPAELAKEVEARGFESLWFPEHPHIPVSRATPFPGGEPLPEEYKGMIDPFIGLALAGAVTDRILLGTSICLVAEHDPIVLAKEVATLDRYTNGRVVLGVGYGWNEEEMENHGVDPRKRHAIAREKVLAIKGLWTNTEFGFAGTYVNFTSSWSQPKPLQQPHPPIVVGGIGTGPVLIRHVAEYGDGWMPFYGIDLPEAWKRLRVAAEEAGRDPDDIEVSIFWAPPDAAVLDELAGLGVKRVIFRLPSEARDGVLPWLDLFAEQLAG
jgi:probable F420-dependent oxidoreductase